MMFVQDEMKALSLIMYKMTILLLSFLALTSCKSQEIENNNISHLDNFSNESYNQGYNSYLNHIANENQLKTVKVLYNKKIFEFKKFNDKFGLNEKLDIRIIKDSVKISEYQIKNCNILIIAKDK